jgi:hypothetical protein
LLEERFESDGEAFSKKYSNSTLVVEGAVDTTDDEYLEKYGFFVVRLGGGGRSLGSVRCVFEGYNVAEAKKIKKGTVVRVKGKYSGSGKLEVGVKQCQIMPN